jgi:hypothetical protein
MRKMLVLAALALSACGPTTPADPPPDPQAASEVSDTVEALPHHLPPTGAEPRFVGSWATTDDGCDDPAWIINAHEMHTQGEVSCTFNDVSEIPGGYNVQATCHAEGETTQHDMQLTFAESAQAMMIAGGPWSPDPGLLYCGPAP